MRRFMNRSRLAVAGLAVVALVLSALIYRDVFVPAKNTGSTLNLYSVARRTVTASVTGTGSLVPMAQANVNFKVSGVLTEIDATVGGHVTAGEVLARVDATNQNQALAAAQANLQVAQANLQAVETPLTSGQISQLQHNLAIAQQSYNDTVTQVNFTNTQDASQVSADKNQLSIDQQIFNNSLSYQLDLQALSSANSALQTAIATFNADGCQAYAYPFTSPPAPASCLADYTTVSGDQSAVNTARGKVTLDEAQVNADQSKLNLDSARQQQDLISGQRSINAAASQVTSARDQLTTQTQTRPNQVAAAQAQLSSAQAAVQTAQQNVASTTLVSPMNGTVNGPKRRCRRQVRRAASWSSATTAGWKSWCRSRSQMQRAWPAARTPRSPSTRCPT